MNEPTTNIDSHPKASMSQGPEQGGEDRTAAYVIPSGRLGGHLG